MWRTYSTEPGVERLKRQDMADQKQAAKQIAGGAFGDNTRRGVRDATAADDFKPAFSTWKPNNWPRLIRSNANIFAKDTDRERPPTRSTVWCERAGRCGQGIGALASTEQGMNTAGVDARAHEDWRREAKDKAVDLAYGDFLAQTNYPKEQGPLSSQTSCLSVPSSSPIHNIWSRLQTSLASLPVQAFWVLLCMALAAALEV